MAKEIWTPEKLFKVSQAMIQIGAHMPDGWCETEPARNLQDYLADKMVEDMQRNRHFKGCESCKWFRKDTDYGRQYCKKTDEDIDDERKFITCEGWEERK